MGTDRGRAERRTKLKNHAEGRGFGRRGYKRDIIQPISTWFQLSRELDYIKITLFFVFGLFSGVVDQIVLLHRLSTSLGILKVE